MAPSYHAAVSFEERDELKSRCDSSARQGMIATLRSRGVRCGLVIAAHGLAHEAGKSLKASFPSGPLGCDVLLAVIGSNRFASGIDRRFGATVVKLIFAAGITYVLGCRAASASPSHVGSRAFRTFLIDRGAIRMADQKRILRGAFSSQILRAPHLFRLVAPVALSMARTAAAAVVAMPRTSGEKGDLHATPVCDR